MAGVVNQLPALGVYGAEAMLVDGRRCAAAVNIGRLPTVGDDRPITVEAHLLDFEGDCYDHELVLDLRHRIRGEQKFDGLESLQTQIHADVAEVRRLNLCFGADAT